MIKKLARYLLVFAAGILLTLYFLQKNNTQEEDIALLQKSIKQVSKLVVTEAEYTQVFTHKSQDAYLFDWVKFQKKAVVLGSITAMVNFDLKKMKYKLLEDQKIIKITYIPEAEINYSYDFKWMDVDQSRLNQFDKKDLNSIQESAKNSLIQKINKDELILQAEQRLVEELKNIWLVAKALGWEVQSEKGVSDYFLN